MVLIGADEQGGAKMGESVLRRVLGHRAEAHPVAVQAAAGVVAVHIVQKRPQAVLAPDDQLQADAAGVLLQRLPPGAELRIGVDVGVVPVSGGLDALLPEGLDAHDGAGRAADVEQQVHSGRLPWVKSGALYQIRMAIIPHLRPCIQ